MNDEVRRRVSWLAMTTTAIAKLTGRLRLAATVLGITVYFGGPLVVFLFHVQMTGTLWFCAGAGWVVAVAMWIAAWLLDRYGARLRTRELRANAVDDDLPPVLVIRSFADTMLTRDMVGFNPSSGDITGPRGGFEPAHASLRVFGRVLSTFGRPISISTRRDEIPPDPKHDILVLNAPLQQDWWPIFTLAATHCRFIVIIPEVTASIRREIAHVRSREHLSKCLVYMPPTPLVDQRGFTLWAKPDFETYDRQSPARGRWEVVRRSLRDDGVDLPAYEPCGMFYRPDERFAIEAAVRLERIEQHEVAKLGSVLSGALNRLVPVLSPATGTTADLMRELTGR